MCSVALALNTDVLSFTNVINYILIPAFQFGKTLHIQHETAKTLTGFLQTGKGYQMTGSDLWIIKLTIALKTPIIIAL